MPPVSPSRDPYAPSSIQSIVREKLVLHTPEINRLIIPILALSSIGLFFTATHCPDIPGCMKPDTSWWLIPLLYLFGSLLFFGCFGAYRSRKILTFDFNRQELSYYHYSKQDKKFITTTIRFNEIKSLSGHRIRSIDDDFWKLTIFLQNGEELPVLQSSREETAFKVFRRLIEIIPPSPENAESLFPRTREKSSSQFSDTNSAFNGRLTKTRTSEGIHFTSKPQSISAVNAFLVIFTTCWWSMIFLMFIQFPQLIGSDPSKLLSNLLFSIVFVLIFVGFGLLALFMTLWMLAGVETLFVSSERIIKKDIIFGKTISQKSFELSSVLRVDISDIDSNCVLKVFTAEQIVQFGSGLRKEELQRLQQEIDQFRSRFF